jgi:hypothetical protein
LLHRRKEAEISNCLCDCYIEERQGYQTVYVNVTRISNCLCECYIKERQRYQIVYVNVTLKRGRDIKLLM